MKRKGRKFFYGVENAVGKGEIAHSKQFLLFPQFVLVLVVHTCKDKGLFGKKLDDGFYTLQSVSVLVIAVCFCGTWRIMCGASRNHPEQKRL